MRTQEVLQHHFALQSGRLFLWLPVALGAGIATYYSMKFEPGFQTFAIVAVVCLALILIAHFLHHRFVAFWSITLSIGFFLAAFEAHQLAAPKLSYRYYGPVEGRIIAIDRSVRERPRVTLDRVKLGRIPPYKTPKKIRISLHFETSFVDLFPGQIVMLTAHLSPPSGPVEPGGFDFERHAWFRGLGAVGYSRTPLLALAPPDAGGALITLTRLRKTLAASIEGKIPGREGAFAAAILVGERAKINQIDLDALRASNLAHLLAISGLHMGLLTGFVFAAVQLTLAALPRVALHLPVRKIAAVFAMIAALIYLGVSGASVATQRAFVMALVIFLAVFLDRRALTLHAVAFAATLLLVLHPHSLNEAGFQMSFAATTGLVAVFAMLRDKSWMRFGSGRLGKIWAWGLGLLISSFVAGAATAPFSAFHFNQVSQFGLIANLLSVPVMGLVIMPSAILATLLSPFGIDGVLWSFVGAGIHWILTIAHWVASFEGATRALVKPENWVFNMLVLSLLWFVLWKGWLRILAVPTLLIAFAFWSSTKRPDILISDDGRYAGILIAGKRSLSRAKGHGFAASSWLENDGDSRTQAQAAEGFEWPPELILSTQNDAVPDCGRYKIAVFPSISVAQTSKCLLLGKEHFRTHGSTAFWLDGSEIRMLSSRSYSGRRLWHRADQ